MILENFSMWLHLQSYFNNVRFYFYILFSFLKMKSTLKTFFLSPFPTTFSTLS